MSGGGGRAGAADDVRLTCRGTPRARSVCLSVCDAVCDKPLWPSGLWAPSPRCAMSRRRSLTISRRIGPRHGGGIGAPVAGGSHLTKRAAWEQHISHKTRRAESYLPEGGGGRAGAADDPGAVPRGWQGGDVFAPPAVAAHRLPGHERHQQAHHQGGVHQQAHQLPRGLDMDIKP
eukprot:1191778-Prorocentrum_minimum.AAC.2